MSDDFQRQLITIGIKGTTHFEGDCLYNAVTGALLSFVAVQLFLKMQLL